MEKMRNRIDMIISFHLFGALDELNTLLGLGDQIRNHSIKSGLLGGGQGAVVQHLLHTVGAQAHLSIVNKSKIKKSQYNS